MQTPSVLLPSPGMLLLCMVHDPGAAAETFTIRARDCSWCRKVHSLKRTPTDWNRPLYLPRLIKHAALKADTDLTRTSDNVAGSHPMLTLVWSIDTRRSISASVKNAVQTSVLVSKQLI